MHLDELESHLRRHIDALDVVLTRLSVLSLRGQCIPQGKVFRPLRLAIAFGALLCWQRPTVKDNVRLYVVVAEQPHTMHRIVDIPTMKD